MNLSALNTAMQEAKPSGMSLAQLAYMAAVSSRTLVSISNGKAFSISEAPLTSKQIGGKKRGSAASRGGIIRLALALGRNPDEWLDFIEQPPTTEKEIKKERSKIRSSWSSPASSLEILPSGRSYLMVLRIPGDLPRLSVVHATSEIGPDTVLLTYLKRIKCMPETVEEKRRLTELFLEMPTAGRAEYHMPQFPGCTLEVFVLDLIPTYVVTSAARVLECP